MDKESKQALENFLLDIDILDKLNRYINQFNIFDILKISRFEIRHSNVLSWLLDPKETHGLDDVFIRKFIQLCIRKDVKNIGGINIIQSSLFEYNDFIISREWQNIDILLVSRNNNVVLCIENKVYSRESENQLQKYYKIIEKNYPSYNKIFMFLTPEGNESSNPQKWNTINYREIIEILEESIELKKENMNNEAFNFIKQYIQTVRRYILMDEDLVKACTEIYNKHQKALDLIFEYKEDTDLAIKNIIENSLRRYDDILIDVCNKKYIRFIPQKLEDIIEKKGDGWTSTSRILLYEFQNIRDMIVLKLIIGPTTEEYYNIREELFRLAKEHKEVFKGQVKNLSSKYTQVYATPVISKKVMETKNLELIKQEIDIFVENFMNNDSKKIDKLIIENYKILNK